MFPQCVNYDFAKNWHSAIVPHLKTDIMKKLIKHTHTQRKWAHDYPQNWHYSEDEAPASMLTSLDCHCTMIDTMVRTAVKKKDPRLSLQQIADYRAVDYVSSDEEEDEPKSTDAKQEDKMLKTDKDVKQEDKMSIDSTKKDESMHKELSHKEQEEHWEKFEAIRYPIEDILGCNYKKNPELMVHWVAFSCCHWFNKYVCMYLATQVCPEIHWKLLSTETHTTVVSEDGKLMFDLLAFCYNHDRFESYCCNLPYEETDPSLGANESIELMMQNRTVRWSSLLKRCIDFDPVKVMTVHNQQENLRLAYQRYSEHW